MKKILICLLCVILLGGCGSKNSSKDELISYMKAKELIINEGAVLVDVRTEEEYNEKHIDGAKLLTLDTITEETANKILANKDNQIIVYCKSGKRSAEAKKKLEELGYSRVYDLGSIDNWKE